MLGQTEWNDLPDYEGTVACELDVPVYRILDVGYGSCYCPAWPILDLSTLAFGAITGQAGEYIY